MDPLGYSNDPKQGHLDTWIGRHTFIFPPTPQKKNPEVPKPAKATRLWDMCEMTIWEGGKTQYVRSTL